MRYSELARRLGGGGANAWAVHLHALTLRKAGQEIIFLTVGDPDQGPPEAVTRAAITALEAGQTGYSDILGLPALREAIAQRVARRSGRPCGIDNVVVVPGAQAGLYCAMQCIAEAGDDILLPEPIYATYEAVIAAAGATMVTVPLQASRGFHPDIDSLARAITPRTRALWINTPHNPTGAVLDQAEMQAIADLARRHDLWLLSDEVYEDLAYARPHVGAWSLPDMADRTIVVSSLSKSHTMPGYRVGWIVGPPALSKHLFNVILCMLYGSPPFIQRAALAALSQDLPEVAANHATYRNRAALLSGILAGAPGCRVDMPEGGMFLLMDVRGTGLDSARFAWELLAQERIAVLPADTFGASAVGHVRISLTVADATLQRAGHRIVAFTQRLAAGRT